MPVISDSIKVLESTWNQSVLPTTGRTLAQYQNSAIYSTNAERHVQKPWGQMQFKRMMAPILH